MTLKEAQAVVDARIKKQQDADAKRFEQLMQNFERSHERKVVEVAIALLDKLEEIVDMEIKERKHER